MNAQRAGLVIAMCLAACGRSGDGDEPREPAQGVVAGAKVEVVHTAPFTETIGAIGSVQARAGHSAALAAPSPTRVTRVLVSMGQRVNVGQPLVELDAAAFRAQLNSAEAAFASAERAFERAQRLNQEGIAPRKDVEAANAELARARSDLVSARRQLELATIRSPLSGVVTRLVAAIGSPADVTQPLVEVVDPSALDILLSVTPTQAGRVRTGNKVTLAAGQNAAGEPLGIGTVADVSSAIDTVTRSVGVRVTMPAARRPLRVGETVFGQIGVAMRPSAVVVPIVALVPDGENFKVFVVDAAGIAHSRSVEVGAKTDSLAEIRNGLAAGERVVTYGAYGVDDSAKVVVKP